MFNHKIVVKIISVAQVA